MLDKAYKNSLKQSLTDSANLIVSAIENDETLENISKTCKNYGEKTGMRSSIINVKGEILFDSDREFLEMTNHLNRPEIQKALKGESAFVTRYSNTLNLHMLYLALPAQKLEDGTFNYCVRMAIPEQNLTLAKEVLFKQIFSIAIISLLFSVLISFILAKKIETQVRSLKEIAKSFADGNFDKSVGRYSIYEISELAKSMKYMAMQLKKRLNSLHKRNCELDEIFSHMSECVFICSDEGLILKANARAKEIFKINIEENFRPKISDTIANMYLVNAITKTFENDNSFSCDIEIDNSDTIFAFESLLLPYQSRTRRALIVLYDISLIRATEKLRREFVAGVSHELKTPITGIIGAAEMLKDAESINEREQLQNIISRDSKRMDTLIDDMLLLSKIESAENFTKENFTEIKIKNILNEAFSIHENEINTRKDIVKIECTDDLKIKGNFKLLTMAVSNLLSNAIKYCQDGTQIFISATKLNDEIKICVTDNGQGIAPQHLPRLFERFYRIDKGRSRDLGGTGIGLAIVKHIAILHSGNVFAESEIGKGSTFTITFKI